MKTAIDTLADRLEILMCDVHFRSDYDRALHSTEHLLAIGEHTTREFKKIEALDGERQERIQNLVSNILANVLQKAAIEQFGNANGESIRRVLHDWHKQPENQAYWVNMMHSAQDSLEGTDLTAEQRDGVIVLFESLPTTLTETLVELISPLRLFPRAEAPSIATALADMMRKELLA